jgi:segregation and condensation protein B
MSDLDSQSGTPAAQTSDETAPTSTLDEEFEPNTATIIEALLFATDEPLPARKIAEILEFGDVRDVKSRIAELNAEYEQSGRSFRIESVAGGFQMMTIPPFNDWLTKLLRVRRESKLSGAAMETLAVIAYRQPVLRADIEAIRGVSVGDMVNRLRESNLVKIVGRAEEPGRPLLYGTTRRFLEVFGLSSLKDLPPVDDAFPMPVAGRSNDADDQVVETVDSTNEPESEESNPSQPDK